MQKLILLDCDGILLHFNNSYQNWMLEQGYPVLEPNAYDFALKYGISNNLVSNMCESFCSSTNMENLEFIENSSFYINRLYAEFGFKFHIITSISNDPVVYQARLNNLLKEIEPEAIHDITCLGFLENKYHYLNDNYGQSGLWWIEDSVTNFKDGEKAGLKSLLLDHPYNQGYNTPNRVFSWKEIYERIIS